MVLPRIIPLLLLRNRGLVKTVKFSSEKYIGDPLNAVKIFNDKEADEIVLLDIDASKKGLEPNYDLIKSIATECFMPLSYGGGIKTVNQAKRLIQSGVEKIVVNTQALTHPNFVSELVHTFGSSTIIGAMDVKTNFWGKHRVYSHVKAELLNENPLEHALKLQSLGVGELFLNNVDYDGVMKGYDYELVDEVCKAVDIPVISCGGAGSVHDLKKVIHESGAAAAAAGSLFVFHGKHKAVLITYPPAQTIKDIIE